MIYCNMQHVFLDTKTNGIFVYVITEKYYNDILFAIHKQSIERSPDNTQRFDTI